MNFVSYEFAAFFSVTVALWFLLNRKALWFVGVFSSLYFYYSWSPWFPALLLVPVIGVYLLTKDTGRERSLSRFKFITSLLLSLGSLLFFKLNGIVGDTLQSLNIMGAEEIRNSSFFFLLPVGLSFFTFRLVSYVADIYNGRLESERHFGNFALYIMFFPQLLAGPIERGKDFLPQLREKISFDWDRCISGVHLFFWGVFKKLAVSERLLPYVEECFAHPTGKGIGLLFGAWFYSFVIYCDFSGYTDMAIGLARILGIKSADNFNYPYFSRSITQFWNRWHISLSTWLRDYLFLPVSYSIMKRIKGDRLLNLKTETWGYVAGMSITMLLGGFWHGDKWTFIVWGLLHALFLVSSFLTKKKRRKFVKRTGLKNYPKIHKAINIFTTFNMVTLAWIFFYADDITQAYTYISKTGIKIPDGSVGHIVFNSIVVMVFLLLEYLHRHRHALIEKFRIPDLMKPVLFAIFVCILIVFSVDKSNFFIYMRF